MSVYVDDVRHAFRGMWADTLDELLVMADRIGVARRWLRTPPKASWVHFDISQGKKARALRYGAILTDMFRPGRVPGAWRSAPARVRSSTNACADSVTRAGSSPGCLRAGGRFRQ